MHSSIVGFMLIVFLISILAGFLGSLTGLGGGIVITPVLTLLFGIKIQYAIGATLVSVIATSSGAAAAYVREGFSNIRIGVFLEIATTLGAVGGALLAVRIHPSVIAVIFGAVLLMSAYMSGRPRQDRIEDSPGSPLAARLKMNSSFPTLEGPRYYQVHNVLPGFSIMFVAGICFPRFRRPWADPAGHVGRLLTSKPKERGSRCWPEPKY